MSHSPGLDLSIYVKVARDSTLASDTEPRSVWVYPDQLLNDFKSLSNDGYATNHITVPFEFLKEKQCLEDQKLVCVITLSVKVNVTEQRPFQANQVFSITATQWITQLQVSTPIVGYVAKDSIVYYRAFVPENEKSLLISCNTLSQGDPDIYVNKGHNRPTVSTFDWSSQGFKSDQIIINEENLGGEYVYDQ
jgi:hypothetical protein